MPAPEEARTQSSRGIPASLDAAVARLAATHGGLLVGLDFDGTLAPIAADPDAPTLDPAAREPLASLVRAESAEVAVVSGRQVDDLRRRVGIAGATYAGNHGLELRRNGRTTAHPTARRHRPAIRRACESVAGRLATIPGWEIEDKGVTATVHYRSVPAPLVPEVRSAVRAALTETAGPLDVTAGKQILEIRPAVAWDKGRLLLHLSSLVPADWGVLYVGDDTTDEDAFRAIEPEGIGVRVGNGGDGDDEGDVDAPEGVRDTAASHVLPDRTGVPVVLSRLVDRLG